jgi:hypothetical protein
MSQPPFAAAVAVVEAFVAFASAAAGRGETGSETGVVSMVFAIQGARGRRHASRGELAGSLLSELTAQADRHGGN